MGLNNHYRSVSTNDEFNNLPEKGRIRSGWGKQSFLLSLATGTLCVAIIAAVLSTISSAVLSYTSPPSTATVSASASAAAVIASSSSSAYSSSSSSAAPTPTAILDDTVTNIEPVIPSADTIQHCGGNPDEARERGCVFDVMMQLWTPSDCFDEVLSNRFLEVGNWTWYADPGAEHVFTLEEMRKGEHDAVFVAQDYHITHCIYAWEKLVRAMRNQEPLIEELISYDHVIHCRHKTLQRADGGSSIRGVRAPTGYTKCAPYDTWKYHLPANEHSSVD